VGVIPDPEIIEYEIAIDDQFLVIASDGVWEFLSNEEVAKIAYPFFSKSAPEAAANALVKEAYKKWKTVISFFNSFIGRRSNR
jgi:serine/threonine protein phosphatase PrpC